MRLSEVGELGLLAELERRGLAQRIENDAAQLDGGLVVTQDALVEGVHFRLDLLSWRELGFRAAAVNLSDLAASGAEPDALVVTLGLPDATDLDDVLALYEGLNEPGVPIVGGDTTRSERVLLSVTALGRSERVPGRARSPPGRLSSSSPGPLGGRALRSGKTGFVRPPLRLVEGRELARRAHALLDISDGLAVDAGHLAARSGVRCVVDLERCRSHVGPSSTTWASGRTTSSWPPSRSRDGSR